MPTAIRLQASRASRRPVTARSIPERRYTLDSINPGFERDPILPQLPDYLRFWVHSLPAGELHPQIDEMAGMVPNTITAPNGGPGHRVPGDPVRRRLPLRTRTTRPVFGNGPPNFGWGPPDSDERLCPQNQSGVAGNHRVPVAGDVAGSEPRDSRTVRSRRRHCATLS